jgi:hypothetical protein
MEVIKIKNSLVIITNANWSTIFKHVVARGSQQVARFVTQGIRSNWEIFLLHILFLFENELILPCDAVTSLLLLPHFLTTMMMPQM